MFAVLPDPAEADGLDDLVERLRALKTWAGDPSYETIKERINAARTERGRPAAELARRSTVANCFQPGRRRLNTDLVVAVVRALHPDTEYVSRWRHALRVIGGETEAVSQVRVHDTLPPDLPGFTGRTGELERLRLIDGAVVIVGMAGVGKTQLAIHAGHRLLAAKTFDRVLFVNLRGFHPDPAQPPADPAAVLEGFLRLLGLPAQQVPHGLTARAAAYRERLAGTRVLVVLDNAATAEQIRALLPDTPGCLTLVTSRRSLHPLPHLAVEVFSPDEAEAFLTDAVPGVPGGADTGATARIAERCGHLPLALSLIAGHIRGLSGWTLTDHADRLDERHRERRLDSGVELALTLSYQHLPGERQRLLRLAALHPGQDFDAFAAAALTDNARAGLDHLCRDHLLQEVTPGRYAFHDLVRAYAADRAHDEDPPAERGAALIRLFDHYLATAAAAMNTLHPTEAHRRPRIPPVATPSPDLTDPDAARAWLDTELPTLVAVAAHGPPGHTTRLAQTVSRHLTNGNYTQALTMQGHALHAARRSGDLAAQANALTDLGFAHLRLGRPERAVEHYGQALDLFRQVGDPVGQARVVFSLGTVAEQSGRYPESIESRRQALDLFRQAGDRTGEAYTLDALALAMERSGRYPEAIDYCTQTLDLARRAGHREGEAFALHGLGDIAVRLGQFGPAGDHLEQALAIFRRLGHRTAEANVLDSLGLLHTRRGRPERAIDYHEQSLAIFRTIGSLDDEAWVLNGLGEATQAAGRAADALGHHTAALTIAAGTGAREQQARAHAGLGDAHQGLGDVDRAREHYRLALTLYTDLGLPEADRIRTSLAE